MTTIKPRVRRFATRYHYVMSAVVFVTLCAARMEAQTSHSHTTVAQPQDVTADDPNNLISVVRKATERFIDVSVAQAEGYALQFGCVTGSDSGAMGLHYVNGNLVNSGVLDPTRPQIVIYEPTSNGALRLTGVDFLVLADQWNKTHSGPPQLMGQLFHLFDAPNRFGLPAFYTLHVWAWKDNPNGAYVNWHPNVSCKYYAAQ
jgi:hypothetical protein